MSSSEELAVNEMVKLIKLSVPIVTRTESGLTITQKGQSFEIPFSQESISVSKNVISKL